MRKRLSNGKQSARCNVIVVGAGAAGIGVAAALMHAGVDDVQIVDRHGVGASFERWPKEMRFITPSFPTNSIGMLDLNSIAIGTSPAFSLEVEHPTGREYAAYLKGVAQHFELPVKTGIDVRCVKKNSHGFTLETSAGSLRSRLVIWAAGEFQYPWLQPFPGAELCRHSAQIDSWESVLGKDAIVIGGYESGVDAAIHLARLGKRVTVLDRLESPAWSNDESDPSLTLSTFTIERLQESGVASRVRLAGGADVREVRRWGSGYEVHCRAGRNYRTATAPILATGFRGSVSLIADHFEQREDHFPLLNSLDESTVTPGLFLTGPMVRHEQHVFCFIYKFRQRFAVVAKAIADRLGLPAGELETYRQWGMYLDDLSCCGEECVC